MKSFDQLQRETTALHLDFLFTDLGACSTFVGIAETTQNSATRARNLRNASLAHAAATRFLPRVFMSGQQNQDLLKRLDVLEERNQSFEGRLRGEEDISGNETRVLHQSGHDRA